MATHECVRRPHSEDAETVLQDRSFIEQMKADILRRAEEISDDEDDEENADGRKTIAFEEELDDESAAVKVRDGDVTDDAEGEGDDEVGDPATGANVCLPASNFHTF